MVVFDAAFGAVNRLGDTWRLELLATGNTDVIGETVDDETGAFETGKMRLGSVRLWIMRLGSERLGR